MKVSVLVATYNGEQFILPQLESIKNQTRQADEVIICDDQSTDQTVAMVSQFIEQNGLSEWKLLLNQTNVGYQKNFYQLLKQASGDIIFLSDQDDVWEPEKLQVMTGVMEQDPEIKSLNSLVTLIDQDSQPVELPRRKNFYNANFLYSDHPLKKVNYFDLSDLIKRNISPGCSMCVRKQVRDEFVATYNFEMPHDWFINLLTSVDRGCAFLNQPLMYYRMHNNNTLGVSADWSAESKVQSFENSRQGKILEFKHLLSSLDIIGRRYRLDTQKFQHFVGYLRARLRFLQKQTLGSLLRLRDYPEYYQTATLRGRLWDFAVALHLNSFAVWLLSFKR